MSARHGGMCGRPGGGDGLVLPITDPGYRAPDEVRALLAELTGKPIDDSVVASPPFHTEFSKNLTLGRGVFINLGCRFQDTAGITIGDDTLDVPANAIVAGVPAKFIRMTGFDAQPD